MLAEEVTKLFDYTSPPATGRSLSLTKFNCILTKQLHDDILIAIEHTMLNQLTCMLTAL